MAEKLHKGKIKLRKNKNSPTGQAGAVPIWLYGSVNVVICHILLALEITLECRGKQRLAETARPTQEEILSAAMRHAINVFRLVYIQQITIYNL